MLFGSSYIEVIPHRKGWIAIHGQQIMKRDGSWVWFKDVRTKECTFKSYNQVMIIAENHFPTGYRKKGFSNGNS